MPRQPTCTKTNGAESAGRVESESPHVGWGGVGGKGSSARSREHIYSAAEGTGGPAQRALLLTARATVHRLLDAADDLPNAAVDGYVSNGQRLPLDAVGEDHVLRGFRQVCGDHRISHGLEDRVGDGPVEAHLPCPFQHRVPLPTAVRSRASPDRLGTARHGTARHGTARHGVAVALTSPPPNMKSSVTIRYSFSATSGTKPYDGYGSTCSHSR